ncbi:unnamed protein product, partial [Ascophyllum nodosum]
MTRRRRWSGSRPRGFGDGEPRDRGQEAFPPGRAQAKDRSR